MTTTKLRYERNTAFAHSLWDRYDLLKLVDTFPELADEHRRQESAYGYSAIQDGWYALNQRTPNQSPAGLAWQKLAGSPEFSTLVDMAHRGGTHTEQALLEVATEFRKSFMRPPEDVEKPPEDDDDAEESENDSSPQETPENPDQPQTTGDNPEAQEDPHDGDGTESDGIRQTPENDDDAEGGGNGAGTGAEMVEENSEDANPEAGRGAVRENASPLQLDPEAAQRKAVISEALTDLVQAEAGLQGSLGYAGETDPRQVAIQEIMLRFPMDILADFIGWTARAVRGARRKSRTATGELTGYRRGGWSSSLHPVDMMRVAQRDPIAMAQMADRALTERVYTDEKPRGRGPVILLRDESSSMEGVGTRGRGNKDSPHSKAVALEMALAKIMNEQHRDLISIAWSSSGTRMFTYGEPGLMRHLTGFLRGGTNIEPALREAVETADKYLQDADILVITDGELHMGSSWYGAGDEDQIVKCYTEILNDFRSNGGRVWAIRLRGLEQHASSAVTLGWTDGYVEVSDLTKKTDAMKKLIVEMASDAPKYDGKVRTRV